MMTSSDLLPPPPPTSPGAASGTTEHKPYSHLHIRNTSGSIKSCKRQSCIILNHFFLHIIVWSFYFFIWYWWMIWWKIAFTVPASSVLVLTDTGLGSPTPTLFLAKTRNSYSTQALRSTTVAVSVFPSITSGTTKKPQQVVNVQG